MDDIVVYDKPVDRVRAFIRDYAQELYGIPAQRAVALAPLVEVAFDPNSRVEHKIAAARELCKFAEVPTRSIEYESAKGGPDYSITIMGECAIEAPEYDERNYDPKLVASQSPSDSAVELHDGRGKEGS